MTRKIIFFNGEPLEIIFYLPMVEKVDYGNKINLNIEKSNITLIYPSKEKKVLEPVKDFAINLDLIKNNVYAILSQNDTSVWPIGKTKFMCNFELLDGTVVNNETGNILVKKNKKHVEISQKPVRPWDLLNPYEQRTSEEVRKERLAICNDCPLFKTEICTACGCIMKAKVILSRAVCPQGKWGTAFS
jgi:hypothetical protein